VLRLFDTGNREECRIVCDLRNAGITVFDRDPATGKQFNISLCEHSGGSLDGVACGFAESPKKWHVLEFKTHNEKSFSEVKSKGVQVAKPLHYAQMQIYMYKMNEANPGEFDRAMYIPVNKNTDEMLGERVRLDHLFAQGLIGAAIAVVESPVAPPALSDDPKNPDCLFCPFHGLCFGTEWKDAGGHWEMFPFNRDRIERNCRTCLHSSPCKRFRPDGPGAWDCAFLGRDLSAADERAPCVHHLFHPDLLRPWSVEDASPSGEWVRYTGGTNYAGGKIVAN
jgi:hypothetical protein